MPSLEPGRVESSRVEERLAPRPRVTQPGLLSLRAWRDRYAYFIDCMVHYLSARWPWALDEREEGVLRRCLERHAHRTSANRFRSFALVK